MEKEKKQRTSHVDLLILGLLSERPMHGYEISKTIASDEMGVWVGVPMPSIYVSLSKLEKRGLVRETAEKEPGKPERGVFHITNKGRETFFATLLRALGQERQDYLPYNIPIFFMNRLSKENAIAALRRRREFVRNWLDSINGVVPEGTDEEFSSTLPVVLDHTRRVTETELKWLDETIGLLEGEEYPAGTLRPFRQPVMVLRGTISDSNLIDTIHIIGTSRRTGILTVKKDHLVRALSFNRGKVAAAATYTMDGVIKREASTEKATRRSVLNEILRIFEWQEGEFVFEEGKLESEMVPLDITNENLILAGCSLVDDWTKITKIVPSTDTIFDQIEVPQKITEGLSLADEEKRILALANGVRDINALAKSGNMSIFEASKALYALVSVGMLTTVGKDKADAFGLFAYITNQLIERLETLRAKRIRDIEEEFNQSMERLLVPLCIRGGVAVESVASGTALSQLVIYEKEGLKVLIDIVSRYLGTRFADQAVRSITNYLPPHLAELFTRYEFGSVLSVGTP